MRTLCLLLGLIVCSVSQADPTTLIYRCEVDGTVVFADQPCDASATPYDTTASLSIIEHSKDLKTGNEAVQALLSHRREQQAERRRLREQVTAAPPAPVVIVEQVQTTPLPWYPRHWRPERRPLPPASIPERPSRYSALSGPFPGTRRTPDPLHQDPPRN
ncbi:hypothetical protein [Wenzhouxiangella marina]|uniref:Uncharacterized protein n=1 Tax=Wenzhouxiangella marina TaxID=1579979 RepID=A0A0K0XW14_9GAMM|nr:hypothetical protein [Wenzhouxiangella marina]AKS41817.1 hypothetical protein WM2015_1445 [Wenzhouxiangella marina]MBB6086421.1 hypothetical protein [Wenzhouxiangella marina]